MTTTTKFAPTHWISNYDLPENGQEVQIIKNDGESVECLFTDGDTGTYRLSELSLHGSSEPCPTGVVYGFASANRGEQPAWFTSKVLAEAFAVRCGWGDAEVGEAEADSVNAVDILE
jgi:hypothetical protein